ncbi:MAG: hypothetical protein AAFO95_07995 [Cyanobacteria bacterium J06600_6]
MNEPKKIKLHWQPTLSVIALALGLSGLDVAPAQSLPEFAEDSWQIAQVGVRGRVTSPTPLNLTPRTHIPLPTNSRSRNYHRPYQYRGRHGRHNRHDPYSYGHSHDHHHHDHHHHHRRRKGPVIIIKPATSSSYSNYSSQDGYIRIIRK